MLLFADKIDVLFDKFLELGCKYLPLNFCLQKRHLLKFQDWLLWIVPQGFKLAYSQAAW